MRQDWTGEIPLTEDEREALEQIIKQHYDDATSDHLYTTLNSMRAAVLKAFKLGTARYL